MDYMNNQINIKIPKKYQERIMEIYHDEDGYWVILNKGWCGYEQGCHVIHEDTQHDMLRSIREIEVCDCDACRE